MIDAFIPDPKYLHGKGILMNGIYHREEMVILLKGSLRIAQNNSFIEDSEEQEEGLKVENAGLRPNFDAGLTGSDRDDNAEDGQRQGRESVV